MEACKNYIEHGVDGVVFYGPMEKYRLRITFSEPTEIPESDVLISWKMPIDDKHEIRIIDTGVNPARLFRVLEKVLGKKVLKINWLSVIGSTLNNPGEPHQGVEEPYDVLLRKAAARRKLSIDEYIKRYGWILMYMGITMGTDEYICCHEATVIIVAEAPVEIMDEIEKRKEEIVKLIRKLYVF